MKKPAIKPALQKLKSRPTFYAGKSTSDVLGEVLDYHTKKNITIDELLDHMHELGFMFILLFVGILGAISPPGINFIVGILPLLLGGQMVLGWDSPWVPSWIGNKKMKTESLRSALERAAPYIEKIENKMKPRMGYFTSKMGEKLLGFFVMICALSIMIPLFFTNMMPGIAISAMALAYIGRDGLFVLISIIFGSIFSMLGYSIAIFTWVFGSEIFDKFQNYFLG